MKVLAIVSICWLVGTLLVLAIAGAFYLFGLPLREAQAEMSRTRWSLVFADRADVDRMGGWW